MGEEFKRNMNKFAYFSASEYCDCDNTEIKRISKSITANCENETEKAVALFYWVRDNILYRVGLWQRKASETLKEMEGTCTNKANLLVALLRSVGIKAGYGIMKVKGREYFGPIALPMLKRMIADKSLHVYCCVELNGNWIKCDPSDDKELSEKTSYFNPTSKLVDWEGEKDAMLNLNPSHILSDEYPTENIDRIIAKKANKSKGIIAKVGNFYIKFLRQNKKRIEDASELEPLFKKWLRRNHFFYYCIFVIVYFFRILKKHYERFSR